MGMFNALNALLRKCMCFPVCYAAKWLLPDFTSNQWCFPRFSSIFKHISNFYWSHCFDVMKSLKTKKIEKWKNFPRYVIYNSETLEFKSEVNESCNSERLLIKFIKFSNQLLKYLFSAICWWNVWFLKSGCRLNLLN